MEAVSLLVIITWYNTIPNIVVYTAVNRSVALAECTPVHYRDWYLKIEDRIP